MPANLTPQYHDAEERFKKATTDEEKLACLEEMMRVIPKHKGTEKMRADMKTRMAKLRAKSQAPKKGAGTRQKANDHVEKHGSAQIALVGPPNCGKSSLLGTVTNTKPEIAEYPFTTRNPLPGMMEFETVQFQIVDLPPITEDYYENWMTNILRNSDMLLLMADLESDNLLEDFDAVLSRLDELKLKLVRKEIPEEYVGSQFCKRAPIAANKIDSPGATDNLDVFQEFYSERFDIFPFSCMTATGIVDLQRHIFNILQIIRVYTKTPGKDVEYKNPIVLPIGATVEDAAYSLHKDFARNLQFAKVWGDGKFDGQRVTSKFELNDKDIIEFHI